MAIKNNVLIGVLLLSQGCVTIPSNYSITKCSFEAPSGITDPETFHTYMSTRRGSLLPALKVTSLASKSIFIHKVEFVACILQNLALYNLRLMVIL
jgi:hypothetical protein